MVADDPPSLADLYAGLQEPGALRIRDSFLGVSTGRGAVTVVTLAAFRDRFGHDPVAGIGPRFAAYTVAVRALGAATALLERNKIPHARREGRVTIGPEDAFGVTLVLVKGEWVSS